MTSLSEQLSAVRQSQWETQLDMLHTLSTRAIDSAEQLIALNMKTSRASVEHATGTLKQLLDANNTRDLAALGTAAQSQWQHVLDYSRALFGIAAGARPAPGLFAMPAMPSLPAVTLPSSMPHAFEQLSIATAAATSRSSEIANAAAATGAALAEATLDAGVQEASKAKEAFTAAAPAPAPEPEVAEVTELDAETAGAGPEEAPAAPPSEEAPAAPPSEDAPAAPPADEAPAAPTSENAPVAPPADEAQLAASAASAAPAPPEEAPIHEHGAHAEHAEHAASATPLGAVFDAAIETPGAEAIPLAKTTQVADAVHQLASAPFGAEHPSAATLPPDTGAPVATPHMTPVDSAPPPAVAASAAPQAKSARASRKK